MIATDLLWPSVPYPRIVYLPCFGWTTFWGYKQYSIPVAEWRRMFAE